MNDLACCDNPAQTNLHEAKPVLVNGRYELEPCWNRICTRCHTHWYGHPDNLKKYTNKEWDLLMNSAFDEPAKVEW
jgi:hypothetical protein